MGLPFIFLFIEHTIVTTKVPAICRSSPRRPSSFQGYPPGDK